MSAPGDDALQLGEPGRGRLFGRNVLEGTFRAAPDEDLFLGELLVGVDEPTGRRYLFRIVDVTYGTEHREPGWAERVAGTLLADDARGESGAHQLYEQGRRTYRVAECRCLGYLTPDGRSFRKPKSLPTQFSRVVAPEPTDFAFLASRMGDLAVGRLRSGEAEVDVAEAGQVVELGEVEQPAQVGGAVEALELPQCLLLRPRPVVRGTEVVDGELGQADAQR